jgi:hypothetical protein
MLVFLKKYFNVIYIATCAVVFMVICLRAFFIPFSHDEAATFFFYIQSDNYLPYEAHVYTNNHVLNSALANICYHLAGSHRFVLRIPNILSFIFLCFAVFNFFKYLNNLSAKVILTCFFILTFNFLDFFELCRGYGLSLAFMTLACSYLQNYFTDLKFRSLILFSLFWQLALAANLTLVIATCVLGLSILIFQYKKQNLFKINNIALNSINLTILIFWIKLSLFYRAKGVLDSGVGVDYWKTSFQSLIFFIFGTDALWIQVSFIVAASFILFFGIRYFFQKPVRMLSIFEPRLFYLMVLTILVVSFYLLNKFFDVNFPEDRTGLFFYVFFVLCFVFFIDHLVRWLANIGAFVLLAASMTFFCNSYNLQSFTHYFYHVLPKEFYSYLESQYKQNQQLFTIGGHVNREMNYAFLNYRAGGMLNPMDDPQQMQMNCDYYIALMCEKPFYRFFYDEIAYDMRWHRVLLKRKQKIQRHEVDSLTRGSQHFKSNDEYADFLRFFDSTAITKNCIEAYIELSFKKVPKPFRAFLVMEIKDENDNRICYKRAPLYWFADELSGQTKCVKLTSVPLRGKNRNILVYLWNIDKKPFDFELKQLKIFNLTAPGINIVIPQNYYPYAKNIIKEELL